MRTGFNPLVSRIDLTAFWAGLALAALFAALPVLWHGYTYPPCSDLFPTCDAELMEGWLKPGVYGYYGHMPAALLGIHLYYRLVPILVFIGLWALLRRYGIAPVFLAWGALFLIVRGPAFDLHNGTFVGLINFYLWGFILLRVVALWAEGKASWFIPTLIASGMVFFHAFTGMVVFAGVALHGVLFRRPHIAYTAALLGASILLSWALLPASVAKISHIKIIAAEAVSPTTMAPASSSLSGGTPVIDSEVGRLVQHPRMEWRRFAKEYVGEGTWIFWALAGIVANFAHKAGWRPRPDVAVVIMALICVPLAIMTFSPLAINADRTAKLMIGGITVLAALTTARGLQHINDRRAYGSAAVVLGISLFYELPQLIPYYMEMGSFR